MKPLNLDNRPCSPISSNCVIWQGPDIPCIKLCTGDTISDVIFKLATELCTIMDQLKVSNYDLSCLNLSACPPEDFQALIQLLINKICELNGIPVDDGKSSGCPDCVVSVAPCLVENGQTTMQLIDYVQMIANKLCSLISEIESINEQISVINTTLVDLQFQIDNLPVYTLPSIQMDCILSGVQPLDAAVNALINNPLGYCALLSSTGTPTDINTAVLSQCITDIDQPLAALPAVNTFSAYYSGSWVNAVALGAAPTVSNAIKNIWVAICDIYNYVSNFPTTVVAAGTNTTVTSSTVGSVTTYTVSCECGAGGLTLTEPCPCGAGLPTNADIYAYIDITSGPYNSANACFTQNRLVLVQSVKQWYDDYQLANPSYTGNLYVFILPAEKYLSYPRGIIQGNIPTAQFLNLTTALVDPSAQPPNWGNAISWVPPTELLYIAFVNESHDWYHGATVPASFIGQPTATNWTVDYNDFVADYTNHWTFFRGVIYPAVTDSTGANLCLQAFGALNNIASITSADLTPALGPTNMGYLGSPAYPLTNPYVTSNEGLWDYEWYGILDKSVVPGPCPQLSFTAKEFGEDLNAILGGGGGGGCDCVSLVDSWDPNSQTLALRSLTSCTLDLSVDEAGCISIESSAAELGGMFAQDGSPASINSQAFTSLASDEFCRASVPIQLIPEVYDDDNAYDPLTGIWTCPADGRYNISCYAHYSRNDDTDGWYNPAYATARLTGMFGIGVFAPTGCSYYCADFITIGGPIRRLDVTSQAMGFALTAGTQLCVKVWNLTGYNYTSFTGDVLRFSIQRIK